MGAPLLFGLVHCKIMTSLSVTSLGTPWSSTASGTVTENIVKYIPIRKKKTSSFLTLFYAHDGGFYNIALVLNTLYALVMACTSAFDFSSFVC